MMVRRSGRMWGMIERSMASPMAEGQASGSLGDYGRTVRHDDCQTLIPHHHHPDGRTVGRALRLGGQVKVRTTVRVALTETIRRLGAGWWGWIPRRGARTV
jgi:hypothetical protein